MSSELHAVKNKYRSAVVTAENTIGGDAVARAHIRHGWAWKSQQSVHMNVVFYLCTTLLHGDIAFVE